MDEFVRSGLLLGKEALERLSTAKVSIFGLGGVGGYVVEALARTGVGSFVLIDNDTVSESNINRQIIALHSTIGKYKADVFKERILDINPRASVEVHKCFYLPENADEIDLSQCDYIVDAVDTVAAKLEIIMRARALSIPVISAMGAGNKLDPTKLSVTDIYSTSACPLARVMRRELKKRGVESLKVVYSTEPPVELSSEAPADISDRPYHNDTSHTKSAGRVPGSVAFVPPAAGLILAAEVVMDLTKR